MNKNNLQQYIILDIDSTSIGGMVVSKNLKKDIVTYHDRRIIHDEKDLDFDEFFLKTQRILGEVCENMSRKLLGPDFAVYCNLSAPWMSSQKRVIHYKKDKEFLFTKELSAGLIKKEIDLPLLENSDFSEHDALTLVERRTIDVYANGYVTHQPYGKKMKTVNIHSLSSVMATSTKETFDAIIERYFHCEASYFSNIFMGYRSLKTVLPYENNVMNIDISGRVTEVSMIKDDHLVHMGTFPVGTQHILHTLSTDLSFSLQKTKSFIDMYQHNMLDEKYIIPIESAMKHALHVWRKPLYDYLDIVAKNGLLPSNICLSTSSSLQYWLSELLLQSEELTTHMHASHNLSVFDMRKVFTENQKYNIDSDDQNMLMIYSFIREVYDLNHG